jgi:alpha-methylacyl-CoA racemase
VYPTLDGQYLAVGPLEPKFYAVFLQLLGVDPADAPGQYDVVGWPRLRELIGQRLASRTRDEWLAVFDGSDGCVAPVLSLAEAAAHQHPHLAEREVFVDLHGVRQPAPAPRFAGTPTGRPVLPPPYPGEHTRQALADWGVSDVDALIADGVVVQS